MQHPSLRTGLAVLLGVVAPLLGSACKAYPQRTAGAFRDFQSGHFGVALEAYSDEEKVGSSFLSGAEAGTVALTAGDWEAALRHLHRAADAAADLEDRALAGVDRLGEALASWALNDTARAYEGEGFERVYVHCGLALAYLAKGLVDDVYVEARRANLLLESEEELYETEYRAGGWGHLISAVTYELIGEPDQAFIDYQRMAEKDVGTAIAGRALVRLATDLHRSDLLPELIERHGPDTERPAGAASIVVLAGVGTGPYKVESSLTLPTGDGILRFAVPGYVERPQPVSGLRLVADSGDSVRSDLVESVARVARENLEDRLGWIAAKSVARGILKREFTQKLEREYDTLGLVAGDLFTLFSERADLRAWLTLPDSWHACRMFVPPGVHGFTLEAIGGEAVALGTYELEPGETMLVFARTLETRLHAHVIGGKPVAPPSEPAIQ